MKEELEQLAKTVQAKIDAIYKDHTEIYKNTEFIGESNGGRCRVTYKNKEIVEVSIQDGVMRELIPDIVMIAVNKALKAATDRHAEMQREVDRLTMDLTMEASKKAVDIIAPLPPEGDLPKNVISLDKSKN
jgi:DNA-binding protein YbaB